MEGEVNDIVISTKEEYKMYVVTFDDHSILRIWSSNLKIKVDAIDMQKYREQYYKKKIEIKNIEEE